MSAVDEPAELRRLRPEDAPALQELLEATPGYTRRISGHAPLPGDAAEILSTLPPGLAREQKYDVGLFRGPTLVAMADVIRNFPEVHHAHIGLLLVRQGHQGKSLGRAMHDAVTNLVSDWPEVTTLRLGIVETNAASAVGFWRALGYEPTGETAPYENDEVRSRVTLWERPVRPTPPPHERTAARPGTGSGRVEETTPPTAPAARRNWAQN
ncbi:GNAT family N-acetyltransferase [Kocuria rhizophila]|uniref:GNAT family N-acetyltransferase n=1 Tax=Kocuria rhizophila TaxID=72000 RepID=UPI001D38499B|nr:GNAT family N-acetyltransferase [Kocuria rhizophila]MCC5672908.1 GNAT family N-acetyltransferase [Kocuria rhizophila]MDV6000149.1 GNAT family N-acetyltransferase [Kocuria rhizophila]